MLLTRILASAAALVQEFVPWALRRSNMKKCGSAANGFAVLFFSKREKYAAHITHPSGSEYKHTPSPARKSNLLASFPCFKRKIDAKNTRRISLIRAARSISIRRRRLVRAICLRIPRVLIKKINVKNARCILSLF